MIYPSKNAIEIRSIDIYKNKIDKSKEILIRVINYC